MSHPHLMDTLAFRDVTFRGGAGSVLFANRPYLDFFADVGTASLGYASDEQRACLEYMLAEHIPLHAPNLYRHKERDRAAERITKLTEMDKVFFCNSGTEAVEGAIKLARKFQYDRGEKRWGIYSYKDGFHGRTYGGLAAGDGPVHHYAGFGPMPEHFHKFVNITDIIPEDAAAVILAPVFGNNDVRVYTDGWLKQLREYTERHDILLIFDEVQTGSGRTGQPTYAQKINVKPDIITLAKGVGMGCPVGAVLARAEVAAAFTPGSHFSTFGGNPLSAVFVNGMIDWLETPGNLDAVEINGRRIRQELEKFGWPRNVRGEGMLIAFDIDIDGLEFSKRCLAEGLLIGAFRPGAGPVKITPPLNTNVGYIQVGLDIMDRVYKDMLGERAPTASAR